MLLRDNVNVTWIIMWGRIQAEESYISSANSSRLTASKFNLHLRFPEKIHNSSTSFLYHTWEWYVQL
jgi:hypothetical protein